MSPELKRLNRIRRYGNYTLSGVGIVAGFGGYFISIVTNDDSAQLIGLAWMFYAVVLTAFGNYVAGIIESSIVHLEEVREIFDKELEEK